MNLFNRAERHRKAWHISRLALDIARRSKQTVWQRVTPQLMYMNLTEARGYLRARAGEPIYAQTAILTAHYGDTDADSVAKIRGQAMEEVIRSIVIDLLKTTRQAEAAPLRIAA